MWSSSQRKQDLPPDWESRRSRVLRRDGFQCQIQGANCSKFATEVDHIKRGNNHSEDNLRAVCSKCHAKKSAAEGHARQRELRARRFRPADRHPGTLTGPGAR